MMLAMIPYQTLVDALTAWQAGATPPAAHQSGSNLRTADTTEPAQAGEPEAVEMMDSGLVEYEAAEYGDEAQADPSEYDGDVQVETAEYDEDVQVEAAEYDEEIQVEASEPGDDTRA